MAGRLTRREKRMLLAAANHVLAGEWPFEEETEERDAAVLESAKEKLLAMVGDPPDPQS